MRIWVKYLPNMVSKLHFELHPPTNRFGQVARGYPKPLRILFSDTKGIQWVDTDATHP